MRKKIRKSKKKAPAGRRQAKKTVRRKTKETDIELKLKINAAGSYKINTQVPFLTHMLEQLAKHGKIDIDIKAAGDVEVDFHHITEDIGITIGNAISMSAGNKSGIRRFGSAYGVLDEAVCRVVLDISGRAYCGYGLKPLKKRIGNFDTELVEEFFNGLARGGKMTLHVDQIKGKNTHHIIEAAFKGTALALREALSPGGTGIPSTKGRL